MEFFKTQKPNGIIGIIGIARFIVVSQPKASALETTNNEVLFQLQAYKVETVAT